MTTDRVDLQRGLLLLSIFLSGCASSGAPAPVEQRQPMQSDARTMPTAIQTPQSQANIARRATSPSEVQVTGLGDDSVRREPQREPAPMWSADTRPEATKTTNSTSPTRPSQANSSGDPDTKFSVANPAVVALLNRANRDAAAGRQGASAASLERAIKIEPGNAWLWHRLAQTRLKQNQPGEAASIAARSNSLAGRDNALRALNWRLIASVHQLRGESVAAQAAQRKAELLEQGIS